MFSLAKILREVLFEKEKPSILPQTRKAELSRVDDLYTYLRGLATQRGQGRKLLMPHDDLFRSGVRSWHPLVNEMREVLGRNNIVSSPLFQTTNSSPYTSLTRHFYCKFFVPHPSDPLTGDLYTLGGIITNEPWDQNSLVRNSGNQQDNITRKEAIKIIGETTAPFADHYIWEVVIDDNTKKSEIPFRYSDFLEGSPDKAKSLEGSGLPEYDLNCFQDTDREIIKPFSTYNQLKK